MAQLARLENRNGVALLWLQNGPANALTPDLRAALLAGLEIAEADPEIEAVVLIGAGGCFSSGQEFAELEQPVQTPSLMTLCDRVDGFPKPIIAALQGVVLGGAVDLAAAAQGRVAQTSTHLGLPPIGVGLLPMGGATQRLPRLIGAERSLHLMLHGHSYAITGSELSGLADEVTEGDVIDTALALARVWIDHPETVRHTAERRDGFADPGKFQAAVNAARGRLETRHAPSEHKLIDCVEAAMLLPLEAGLAYEVAAAEDCRLSTYSTGLRHSQTAQRKAVHFPERRRGQTRDIRHLGLIGGGAAAASIAALAARKGCRVSLFERHDAAVAEARARVAKAVQPLAGRISADELLARISVSTELGDLAAAEMVIETVAENADTKRQVLQALDTLLPSEALRVSHSALLPVDELAQAVRAPENHLAMHFHNPVLTGRLAEVIPGSATSADALVTAADFANALGRVTLRCGTGGGSLVEPLLAALREVGWYFLLQGISPYEVDRVLVDWGLPMGVFGAIDRQGLAVVEKRLSLLHGRADYPHTHATLLRLMLQNDRGGQAAGRGFYLWSEGGGPEPDPELKALLNEGAAWRAPPADGEVLEVVLAALANQGARLLRSEAALRPSDLDVVSVLGLGLPAYRGGIMHAAEQRGMFHMLQVLKARAEEVPALFEPEAGIVELVKNGEGFSALNRVGRKRRKIPA